MKEDAVKPEYMVVRAGIYEVETETFDDLSKAEIFYAESVEDACEDDIYLCSVIKKVINEVTK